MHIRFRRYGILARDLGPSIATTTANPVRVRYKIVDRDLGLELLYQYFPNGSDLSVHTAEDRKRVADILNNRPRKRLPNSERSHD